MNEEMLQYLLENINHQNNEPSNTLKNNEVIQCSEISKEIKTELETEENPLYELLNKTISFPDCQETTEKLNQLLQLFQSSEFNALGGDNNSNLDIISNNEIDMMEQDDEWQEEFKKLDRASCEFDKKDKFQERRRQMAKNREYARKCVQKKKDMRRQAELRSVHISKRIQLQQKFTLIKERNSNFAVDLRVMTEEKGVESLKKNYEFKRESMNRKFDEMFASDETVNLNFHRLSSSREEFEKAAEDLRSKNGVIGTLGSRKIRAKQQMEWRQHLYNISVNEHKLRREMELAKLVDEYVHQAVPGAAPLVQSIPKNLLDELINNNQTSELEEFCRFVGDNSNIIEDNVKESVVK